MAIAHEGPKISDRALNRLVKITAISLGVLLVAFSVVYYVGQHTNAGPTLTERQVTGAEAAVKAAPNNLDVRLQLAVAYQADKRYDDALAQFDQLLKVSPTSKPAMVGKGETQMAMGDLDGAAATFKKVVGAKMTWAYEAIDPKLGQAFYDLGSISATQGKYPEAEQYIAAALKIDATDADSMYLMGTVLLKAGDAAGAVAQLQQAIQFVPTGWCEPYAALNEAFTKLGQGPQAEYAGAMTDFCQGKADSASSRLATLVDGPVKVDAMLGLAMIAEKANDNAEALKWYRAVIKARPDDFTAKSGLDRLTSDTNAALTSGVK